MIKQMTVFVIGSLRIKDANDKSLHLYTSFYISFTMSFADSSKNIIYIMLRDMYMYYVANLEYQNVFTK